MATFGHNSNVVSANSLTSEQRKRLKNAIIELNDSMTRVASERELQKETINELFDELGIEKKVLRRLARTYFKANFQMEQEEHKTFEDFYDLILGSNEEPAAPNVLKTDGWSNK